MKCRNLVLRLSFLFATLTAGDVSGDERTAPKSSRALDTKALDDYVGKQVSDKGFFGLSVAIMEDGKITFAKAYGHSSIDRLATANTKFAAGSITKQFACACVLLLAEDGKLSIHDKVAKWYPKLTRAKDISLYDLMTHVSGYPDYYPLDFIDRRMMKTIPLDKLIEEYAGGKLDFEPGTRWSYSNTGYIILGRVVEKVTGKPFDQFLNEHILKPVGMTHTVFEPKEGVTGLAVGHTSFALGGREAAIPEAEGWIHAAGGLFTTPTDLAKWDLALMEGKVLKPESYQTMVAPRKLADGRVRNYGCGVGIIQRDGETVIRHSGAVSGFLAFNAMVPRTKSAVILMTNCDHLDAGTLNNEIVDRFFKAQAPEIPEIKGPPPKEAALDLLHQMQSGKIKRDNLGEEFNIFLSEKRVEGAVERLKALGEPENVEVESVSERGGMEVAVIRFTFRDKKVKGSLYRTPDGKVQQFLLYGS
jgi:D-alanyl-D-alanine carboxypeptidase